MPRLTARQQEQLANAVALAERDHVVATPGTNSWWIVERPQPGRHRARYHLVQVAGRRLVCDCVASQCGRICSHRAAVHQALVARADVRTASSS
jgi:hypothetical protein